MAKAMRNPNGYGSVVKLSGKRRKQYAVMITIGWNQGKQIRKIISYHKDRGEAIIALAEYNKDPLDHKEAVIKIPTFKDIFEIIMDKNSSKYSLSTQKNYKTAFNHLENLHNRKINTLSALDLQNEFNQFINKNASYPKLNMMKTVCLHIFNYAEKYEYVKKNNAKLIDLESTAKHRTKSVFTSSEIETIWNNNNCEASKVTLIMLYTGMRCSEVLQLKTADIHLDEQYLIGGMKTNAGKNRTVPIHNLLVPIFKELLSPNSEWLFPNTLGTHRTYDVFYANEFKIYMNKLHIGHTTHECRHTFISMMYELNTDPVLLKKIIGHSEKDLTAKVYTHISIKTLVEAVNKLYYC